MSLNPARCASDVLRDIDLSLRDQIAAYVQAYNFAKRLNTLNGLMPYEAIVKCWTNEPNRFILNPNHHMQGPNI